MSGEGWSRWSGVVLGAAVGAVLWGLLAHADEPAKKTDASPAASGSASATAVEEEAEAASEIDSDSRLAALTPAASTRGWELFLSKGCIRCHSIFGSGGIIGPDLGRSRVGQLSEGELMAQMWNSVPRMWAQMETEKIHFERVSQEEMGDLFAFFFYLRYMDEPGDPRQGELAMVRHRCQSCHQVSGEGGAVGPDLAQWSRYTNPVVWVQMMWRAAPIMEARMREERMTWPKFEAGDMVDMIAYIRSVSPSSEKVYLTLGSPSEGAALMAAKKCLRCHSEGGKAPPVAELVIPHNTAEAAVAMLNHAPEMLEEMRALEIEPASIEPQEMAHILAYLLALGYLDEPGDADKGAALFKDRGCVDCHERGTASAPELADMHPEGTVSYMSHVMWNKGPTMIKEMTEAGTAWPIFTRGEMLDLLAFLKEPH